MGTIPSPLIPAGFCQCGCGAPTTPAKIHNVCQSGYVRGAPLRFIHGHNGRVMPPVPIAPRFWAKVLKTDGCWEWQGNRFDTGYGVIKVQSKQRLAHRVSWEIVNGPIPSDMFVCHHCDNRICVRPDHLFLGTPADNMHDMIAKGRRVAPSTVNRVKGSKHHNATLDELQVIALRDAYAAGEGSTVTLAEQYGITQATCWRIVRRLTWKHIP